ncbi:GDP-mannose 4,6-dehydratase [Aeromicrobium sp. Leaf350]|uniref:GDP-mannose 4,6-dehydratase n=1 Tax=Aeromicrobium sp. Leaf350 TaxID=2876565 RepID=UPI001E3D39C6|nr:GDP-mannose 4,6-dehydratase [Aeromicrobium sp. Leaf350]
MTRRSPDAAPRTALITGVSGQDGMFMARRLLRDGWQVVGTVRPGISSLARMAPYLEGVEIVEHDLLDAAGFDELVVRHSPDVVTNFAGFSSVGRSWNDADLVLRTNATTVVAMVESLLRYRDKNARDVRFLQASSAEMFGPDASGALDESAPHRPRTPYAIAKSAAHHTVGAYREKHGLLGSTAILFNHESPFRGQQFVAGRIARLAAQTALGIPARLDLGDLDVERDWGAAADFVDAMAAAVLHEQADDYVLATGTTHTLRDMLTVAGAAAGVDDLVDRVDLSAHLWSSIQAPALLGDATRAREQLGWQPQTSFEDLVTDMVRVDLERLRSGVDESADYLR